MKQAFTIIAFVMISSVIYCQQPAVSKTDYLKKSNRQQNAAWICLGGGAVITATGFIIAGQTKTDDVGKRIGAYIGAGAGILSSIASIPLFIAANNNRQKAAVVSFKMEPLKAFSGSSITIHYYPSVSFSYSL